MRELAILTFVTLDGVMQAPGMPEEDTSGGFEKGGWAMNCWDDVMGKSKEKQWQHHMTCFLVERLTSCSQPIGLVLTKATQSPE